MKSPFQEIDEAFAPMEEPLKWVQDKQPKLTANFRGVVLQGAMETQSAGVQAGRLLADNWTIRLPKDSVIVSKVEFGDVIERECWDK